MSKATENNMQVADSVGHTWQELQDLERETEILLQTVRAKTAPKKQKHLQSKGRLSVGSVSGKSKISKLDGSKTSKQAKRAQSSVTQSLDLDKTRNLYEETRVTVEVFDDASPDGTPRLGYNNTKSGRMQKLADEIQSLKSAQSAELYYRKTGFQDEKTRVLDRKDLFVPAPGVSADDVSKERDRLNKLEVAARKKILEIEKEIDGQKKFLEKDRAVMKVQSLFRGHIGRQKFSLTKQLQDLDAPAGGEWIEVRDRQSGDTWFYNKLTGVSQWDRPDEMLSTLTSDQTLKKLPIIAGTSRSAEMKTTAPDTGGKLQVTMSLPSLDATALSKGSAYAALGGSKHSLGHLQQSTGGYDEEQASKEVDELLGFTKLTPAESLVRPDGAFKPQLRATVLDALVQTRFDTVSSVLADDRWMETDGDLFAIADKNTKKANVVASTFESRVDKSRKPLVSILAINKKEKKGLVIESKSARFDQIGNKKADSRVDDLAELTVTDVEHPGFQTDADANRDSMCFGCWSAGLGRSCVMHENPDGPKRLKSQTMLLCRNWDLGVMRRRYRAEEIQEVFLKKSSSLRYDVKHKVFTTVLELKHQLYREVSNFQRRMNDIFFLFLKIRRWMFTFAEEVRQGNLKSNAAQRQARIMRVRRSHQHYCQVEKYGKLNIDRNPIGPTTGYSWPERIGEIQFLFKHPDQALGHEVELILAYPVPTANHLYLLKECHLIVPRSIPMPRPEYADPTTKEGQAIFAPNQIIDEMSPAAWLERMGASIARDVCTSASSQIKAISPVPGLELLRRTKQPPPCSIKFATLGSKPVPGNLDIIALPKELLISQLISTFVPPQYGNFMVMEKTTVSPGVSPEIIITFESVLMPPGKQIYVLRPVEHPLNYRRAPTISVNTKVKPDDKHYYGLNRPDQTGEQEPHGFRTTTWSVGVYTASETDPYAFTPTAEVATLNNPGANLSVSTHADLKYPFCQPSTRENSTLDFYHLLLTGHLSAAKAQIFTALSVQEPGLFMKNMRDDLPMGHLLVNVYRSWGFTQKDTIEKYFTDDGVPYWYHRRTGQTFWERPMYEDETVSPLHGGTILDMVHPEEPTCIHKSQEGAERRYNQGEFRQLMLSHRENEKEAEKRRKDAGKSAKYARIRGVLPDTPGGEVNPYAGEELDDDRIEEMRKHYDAPKKVSSTVMTVKSSIADDDSVGTHESTESSLLNDHGKKKNMNSPLKQQLIDGRSTATKFDYNMGSIVGDEGSAIPGNPDLLSEGAGSRPDFRSGGSMSSISGQQGKPGQGMNIRGGAPGGGSGMLGGEVPGLENDMMMMLTQNLSKMMSTMMTDNQNPQDMIQLGMGMGMALLSSGAVQGIVQKKAEKSKSELFRVQEEELNSLAMEEGSASIDASFFPHVTEEASIAYSRTKASASLADDETRKSSSKPYRPSGASEPIGLSAPTVIFSSAKTLDQSEGQGQLQQRQQLLDEPLSALDNAKQVKVQQPTVTPDEAPVKELTIELPKNAEDAVKGRVPLLVYPELSTTTDRGAPEEALLHPAAGVGTSFLPKSKADGKEFVEGSDRSLRKAVMPLPVGFFEAIIARHVAGQEVEYLPQVPNLPQARAVGRVKPRSAALDWLAVSFDPWSAGKNPLRTEFLPSLSQKAEKFFPGGAGQAGETMDALRKATVKEAYVNVEDEEGVAQQRAEVSKAQVIADDFKKVCSLCRHSKFADVEQLINQTDWCVPIDYQDDRGNALLHVVAQNGNRRLVKLCLRRGANVNIQNLNGQTPLHFSFGYGYVEVGNYLLKKGADDTLRNKDGLTCYEGLGARELALL